MTVKMTASTPELASVSPWTRDDHGRLIEPMPTAPVTERELAAKAVAPRVTADDIDDAIESSFYFTAHEGVLGEIAIGANGEIAPDAYQIDHPPIPESLRLLTICVLVLRNGFTVVGTSACASPANFDASIGQRVARQDALRQVWPLLGYALREKLAAVPDDYRDRVRQELAELQERGDKLAAFIASDRINKLPADEQNMLGQQLVAMMNYRAVLESRIAAFVAASA